MLLATESSSVLLVMISSKSVSICNRVHAKIVDRSRKHVKNSSAIWRINSTKLKTKNAYFWGSGSFKVIDVGTPTKLSAVFVIMSSKSISNHSHARQVNGDKIAIF